MQNIQKLIETVFDETGAELVVELVFKSQGWRASVLEGEQTVLCPAGEYFLSKGGFDEPEAAMAALDRLVEDGYRIAADFA